MFSLMTCCFESVNIFNYIIFKCGGLEKEREWVLSSAAAFAQISSLQCLSQVRPRFCSRRRASRRPLGLRPLSTRLAFDNHRYLVSHTHLLFPYSCNISIVLLHLLPISLFCLNFISFFKTMDL